MEDRSGRGVQVVPAGRAGPRLALLLGGVALEDLYVATLGALGVFAIGSMASSPQMLQAGGVVGKVGEELGDRVFGGRGLRAAGVVAICRWHSVNILDKTQCVKTVDTLERRAAGGRYVG